MSIDFRSPFVISLADLPHQEGAQREHSLTLPVPESGIGVELLKVTEKSGLNVELTLESVKEGVIARGTVSTKAEGECARCLRPISADVNEYFLDLFYYPERFTASTADDDVEGDELDDPLLIESDHIDIEPVLRDAIVLSLPLRPLCSPQCQGLCSECGERWEDLPQDHAHTYADSRFSALDVLAQQLERDEREQMLGSAQRNDPSGAREAEYGSEAHS